MMKSRNSTRLTVHTFSILIVILTSSATAQNCPTLCKFRFCTRLLRQGTLLQREHRIFVLRSPNVPHGPFPCIKRRTGIVSALRNATAGEALVAIEKSDQPFVPISDFMKSVVKPRFPPNFFGFAEFSRTKRPTLVRRRSRGNQEQILENLCVRLPIKSFLRFSRRNSVDKKDLTVLGGRRDCVSFRTRIVILDIQFRWDTTNDFDIRLREPSGFTISRFGVQHRSPSGGKLIGDAGGSTCQIFLGQERIIYKDVPERGVYKLMVDNTRVCQLSSKYTLTVSYNGRLIVDDAGTISEAGEDVLIRRFTIS